MRDYRITYAQNFQNMQLEMTVNVSDPSSMIWARQNSSTSPIDVFFQVSMRLRCCLLTFNNFGIAFFIPNIQISLRRSLTFMSFATYYILLEVKITLILETLWNNLPMTCISRDYTKTADCLLHMVIYHTLCVAIETNQTSQIL